MIFSIAHFIITCHWYNTKTTSSTDKMSIWIDPFASIDTTDTSIMLYRYQQLHLCFRTAKSRNLYFHQHHQHRFFLRISSQSLKGTRTGKICFRNRDSSLSTDWKSVKEWGLVHHWSSCYYHYLIALKGTKDSAMETVDAQPLMIEILWLIQPNCSCPRIPSLE